MDDRHEEKCLKVGRREQKLEREADFYSLIMGVRCRSHSLKGMKLKLAAINRHMRCVVFRFPFKDISVSKNFIESLSTRIPPECISELES